MSKIKIITDSTAYITKDYILKENIEIIPLTYTFGDESGREGYPGEFGEFYEKLQSTKLFPTTSQPSAGDFLEVFNKAFENNDEIIAILLSSKISGTYNSAVLAKSMLEDKKITAEVCIHHLWFTNEDYATKGNLIKWNPAVKTENDRKVLWEALLDGRIDVIATDHAPHTLEEKKQSYLKAPSGGPLVQHAVVAMFESFHRGQISVEKIVEKMCHNPAKIFKIEKRGFIKVGYYADLVIVNSGLPWSVKKENILAKCGWSPFEGFTFKSRITHTFVNGQLVYTAFKVKDIRAGKRLLFER